MAFPVDNSYILFKAKSGSWAEKVFTPAKGQILSFDANIDPALLTPGTLSTTTTGVTVAGGIDGTLHNVSIDIDTADSTHTGLLSSTDWSTFNGKQAALVSGTNIKTINGSSLLDSGDLTVSGIPAGSTGEIQFNNSGAFGANSRFKCTFVTAGSLVTNKIAANTNDVYIQAQSNDAVDDTAERAFEISCYNPYLDSATGIYFNGATAALYGGTMLDTYSDVIRIFPSTALEDTTYIQIAENTFLDISGVTINSGGVIKHKTFNQASQPTTTNIPDGYSAFWTDTDDSKCYLCYNHGGTIKKVELT